MLFYLQPTSKAQLIVRCSYEQKKGVAPGLFSGKEGECLLLPSVTKGSPHILMLGLGKETEATEETFRNCFGKAVRQGLDLKAEKIQIDPVILFEPAKIRFLRGLAMGMNLRNYCFDKYKSKEGQDLNSPYNRNNMEVYIQGIVDSEVNRAVIKEAQNLTDSINTARDMISEPTNQLYPEEFAARAVAIARESGFEITVLEEEEIRELGMEAFLAVGKGTNHKPRLIVMRYLRGGDKPLKGLVGKGLTCDTGGYSLKTSESLMYMKSDMSGGASVVAVISAIAKNKCNVNVCGVVAACENVVSGDTYKPGDIVPTMAGKMIEVLNTDAEGRLTLADALTYIIEKEGAKQVIDIATLTGAAGTTFGNVYTPMVTNNEKLKEEFFAAAKETEEEFWLMPNHKRYKKMIESNVADIKNTAPASTITAGMFLQEFVEGVPWIHLDIAATAVLDPSPFDYITNGPSGTAIRTLYQWAQSERG